MAPEILESKHYNHKADIYSFGILLWEIFSEKIPYIMLNPYQIMYKVMNGERPDESLIDNSTPKEVVQLMKACWERCSSRRPTAQAISELLSNVYNKVI